MSAEKTLLVVHPTIIRARPVYFLICLVLIIAYGLGLLILIVWYLRSRAVTLTVTDERTRLRKGILSRNIQEVWHRDVRNVNISQSMMQRLTGTGSIEISSSGSDGAEIAVSGIPGPMRIKDLIDQQRRKGR